jgi:hypothetical protein
MVLVMSSEGTIYFHSFRVIMHVKNGITIRKLSDMYGTSSSNSVIHGTTVCNYQSILKWNKSMP